MCIRDRKATVGGRTVLGSAGRAKRKRRQTRLRPVVGQRARYRITRSAVGAGDEGMAPAAARGIEQFSQAVRTYGHIGTDGRSGCRKLATGAFGNGEASQSIRYGIYGIYGVNTGQWGRLRAQSLQQRIDLRLGAFGGNQMCIRDRAWWPPGRPPPPSGASRSRHCGPARAVWPPPCARARERHDRHLAKAEV